MAKAVAVDEIGEVIAQADSARDDKNWHRAELLYKKALEGNEGLAPIWVQLGHSLKEQRNLTEALSAYEKALALEPENSDTFLQIGHLKKIMNRFQQAADQYAAALRLNPLLADARRELSALELRGFRPRPVTHIPTRVPREQIPVASRPESANRVSVTVVGRLGESSGIGLLTHAFISCLRPFDIDVQCIDTRPHESETDYKGAMKDVAVYDSHEIAPPSLVSVFCDVIANSEQDQNYKKLPDSLLKLAYPIFDSSRIPSYWVDRLNCFDGLLVADDCLVSVLLNSGVRRPVFTLPLALEFGHLENVKPVKSDKITFGCVAGFGIRKNLRMLIEAFSEVFGDSSDIRLHVHSTLNFSGHFEELSSYVENLGIKNVSLTCENLSKARYANLLNSFDIYVNVSKGEGFSITPREALLLGKPTILSDNTAHHTIVKTGLVFSVPTSHYEPAVFEAFGNLTCGYQAVPDKKVLKQMMVQAISGRTPVRKKEMRDFALKYSIDEMKWLYRQAVLPKDVFMGEENRIYRSHVVTRDAKFYDAAQSVRRIQKARVPEEERQKLVVVGHDGGFFSLFNTFVSYLTWNIGRPEVSCIVPDWRISRIQEHRKATSFTSFCYGQRSDGNVWLKLFYPLPGQDADEYDYNDSDFLEESAVTLDRFNEDNEPLLTYIHAYRLYRTPGFQEWRKWYNVYLQEFVRLRDHLTAEIETFVANNFKAKFIVGCHVRHPSHGIEQPGNSIPTVELFLNHIIRRVAGISDFQVFLATDQDSVVETFRNVFGDRLICRNDVARVDVEQDKKFMSLSETERQKEGHQIQHLTASDESRWSTRMAEEVIIDTYLLAKTNCFIHITSNIATAVSFINPDLEMIYCE